MGPIGLSACFYIQWLHGIGCMLAFTYSSCWHFHTLRSSNAEYLRLLKCHCNEKIVNSILILKEEHLQIRLDGVFSFLISCFVSEIFKFLKHAN